MHAVKYKVLIKLIQNNKEQSKKKFGGRNIHVRQIHVASGGPGGLFFHSKHFFFLIYREKKSKLRWSWPPRFWEHVKNCIERKEINSEIAVI